MTKKKCKNCKRGFGIQTPSIVDSRYGRFCDEQCNKEFIEVKEKTVSNV